MALTRVDLNFLSGLLGFSLALYASFNLAGFRPTIKRALERRAAAPLGLLNGILTGMTGSYVVPGIMYLQAIGLSRDEQVQAMGLLFSLSTVALAISLGGAGLITASTAISSLLVLAPVGTGMILGQRMRTKLSEDAFRKATMISFLALGTHLMLGAII